MTFYRLEYLFRTHLHSMNITDYTLVNRNILAYCVEIERKYRNNYENKQTIEFLSPTDRLRKVVHND